MHMPFSFQNKHPPRHRHGPRNASISLHSRYGSVDRHTAEKKRITHSHHSMPRAAANIPTKRRCKIKKYLFIYLFFFPVEGDDVRHLSPRSNIRSGSARMWRAAPRQTNLSNIARRRVGGSDGCEEEPPDESLARRSEERV